MPTPDGYTEVEVEGIFYSVGLNVTTTDEEVGTCHDCGKPAIHHVLDQLISITNTATYEEVEVESELGQTIKTEMERWLSLDDECEECAATTTQACMGL